MSQAKKQKVPSERDLREQHKKDKAQAAQAALEKAAEDAFMARTPYTEIELRGFTHAQYLLLSDRQLRDPYTLQQSTSRFEARLHPPGQGIVQYGLNGLPINPKPPVNTRLAPSAASAPSVTLSATADVHQAAILTATDSPMEAIAMEAVTEVRSALPTAGTITVDIAPLHEADPVEGEAVMAPRSRSGSDASAHIIGKTNGDIINTANGKMYNLFKPTDCSEQRKHEAAEAKRWRKERADSSSSSGSESEEEEAPGKSSSSSART
jgi:hypothetical protein